MKCTKLKHTTRWVLKPVYVPVYPVSLSRSKTFHHPTSFLCACSESMPTHRPYFHSHSWVWPGPELPISGILQRVLLWAWRPRPPVHQSFFLFFNYWGVSCGINRSPFMYLFFFWGTFELFPCFGYYGYSCASLLVDVCFYFPWINKHLGVEFWVSFVRNCQVDFRSVCTILHAHQQRRRVPVSPHVRQHLVGSVC